MRFLFLPVILLVLGGLLISCNRIDATAKPDMTWRATTPCLDHVMRPLPPTTQAVADARVTNTGNVGIITRVVATWDRAGHPQLEATKEVHVPYGSTRFVHFHMPIDEASMDAIYSANRCDLDVRIVDTYGEAHGSEAVTNTESASTIGGTTSPVVVAITRKAQHVLSESSAFYDTSLSRRRRRALDELRARLVTDSGITPDEVAAVEFLLGILDHD